MKLLTALLPTTLLALSYATREGGEIRCSLKSTKKAKASSKGNKTDKLANIPGVAETTVLLAADNNYPPYANLGPASDDFPLSGFGPDFALLLNDVCPELTFEVTAVINGRNKQLPSSHVADTS